MCGRYYIEISDAALKELIDDIMRRMSDQDNLQQLSFKLSGEIFPTDIVPVQSGPQQYSLMRWGFSGFPTTRENADGSKTSRAAKPIINARSETVTAKPMFRQPVLSQRCLIPASGYYEWRKTGSGKTKYQLYLPDQPIFMAGCYRYEADAISPDRFGHFVILTKPAAEDIFEIHDRMPVIFDQPGGLLWLNQGVDALSQSVNELTYAVA